MLIRPASEQRQHLQRGDARPVEEMRTDAGPVEHQTDAAGGASRKAFRVSEVHLAPALRAGDPHGVGEATASPQLVQNFVRGGRTVRQ